MSGNAPEHVLRSRRLTLEPHQHAKQETDVGPVRTGGFWNLGDPANDGGHLASFEDLRAPGHDDLEGVVPVPGPKQVLDACAHLSSLEVPRCSLIEQTALEIRVLGP